jgi:FKBP-type peptidyl-prolyl cis-trans isomerase FkpA
MRKGIEIESEALGNDRGRVARRGDTVTIRYQLFLNHGDLIEQQETTFTLGQRQVIAGLEYGVEGMLVGGTRRFRIGPHLAYRDEGVSGTIPPHAVLIFEVELLEVHAAVPRFPNRTSAKR